LLVKEIKRITGEKKKKKEEIEVKEVENEIIADDVDKIEIEKNRTAKSISKLKTLLSI
jgi:hypothetical protein